MESRTENMRTAIREFVMPIDKDGGMTILDLYVACKEQIMAGNAYESVIVAYHWKGDTVCSDINSYCMNGKSMQLNEGDFYEKLRGV